MSKLRSLNTAFWSDPFIEELIPIQKLLYIYLITNDKTNMLGIYEVSIKKISFDTGIKKDDVINSLKEFESVGKVKRIDNYIILTNYLKHQNFNTNMKKSAIDVYNSLPKGLKDNKLVVSKDNPIESFESLLKHYVMVSKVEVEYEVEDETEVEDEIPDLDIFPTFEDFWNLYDKKRGSKEKIKTKWDKLKQQEKEDIISYIPNYILTNPDKQFRKDPSTFLNNESWKDELIYKTQTIQNGTEKLIAELASTIKQNDRGRY